MCLPSVYPPDFPSAALLTCKATTLKALCLIYFNIPAIEMFALIRPSKLPSTDELSGDFLLFFSAHSQAIQNESGYIAVCVWIVEMIPRKLNSLH